MIEFHFDPLAEAPTISALISSPKGRRKVQLIFDTGAERTQLRRRPMQRIGYSEDAKTRNAKAVGVGGAAEQGYMVMIPRLSFLGSFADNVELAIFDMEYLDNKNIDGLFGWDFVRLFHLEMNGPKGLLRVF